MKALFRVLVCSLLSVLLFVSGCEQSQVTTQAPGEAQTEGPVAWWKFDEARGKVTVDSVTGNKDDIRRTFWYRQGVSGNAIKCDGFTTHIIRDSADAPSLKDAFTVEAWVAPQAFPYNWCAIVNQEKDHKAGYFFGISELGQIALNISVDGKWFECATEKKIPFMTKWSHIAGTFDNSKGITVYIDGEVAAEQRTTGKFTPAADTDLQIGRNHKKTQMVPESLVRPDVNFPVSYSFDGLIDELKIYNRALTAEQIKQAYEKSNPNAAPALEWRRLPEIQPSDRFGAFYTRLKFYPEWDNLWRVGDHPDIVVTFDEGPYSMVFWRGTNYNMNLVTENGKWVADQSAEGGGGNVQGCCEHMSDKQCRYARVRLIENHDARVVVHWRYAVCDVLYRIANMNRGRWGAWADEYYYIYPDGAAVRAFTVYNMNGEHSITEPASLNNPGERAEDNLHVDALIQANMKGEIRRQRWDPWPSSGRVAAPFRNDLKDANINIVNFKSKSKPYYIYEPGTRVIPYGGGLIELKDYSKFPTWNHWPVSQAPSDGRYAWNTDRVSSSAVTSPEPAVDEPVDEDGTSHGRFIMGLTDQPIEKLAPIARAWLGPPSLTVTRGPFKNEGYSRDQRAFIISCEDKTEALELEIDASEESPVFNPAFVIKDWGEDDARLKIDGTEIELGKNFRLGHYRRLEATNLIVWVRTEITKPVRIIISPVVN
ncbi:MAG TPA: LamG domain-containing protein [Planctomycetes bacterium]|nr:LamG domain-containing protein [Planctomycetota bacterium]